MNKKILIVFFREGGRDWDSGRKMEGDRAWQGVNTGVLVALHILKYSSFTYCKIVVTEGTKSSRPKE